MYSEEHSHFSSSVHTAPGVTQLSTGSMVQSSPILTVNKALFAKHQSIKHHKDLKKIEPLCALTK
jgi:hypothetical protein